MSSHVSVSEDTHLLGSGEITPRYIEDNRKSLFTSQNIVEDEYVPQTSWWTCLFNLSNTAIGAGILTIPRLFAQSGLVLGIIMVVVVGGLNTLALHFLSVSSEVSGAKSYIGNAKYFFGKKGEYALTTTMFVLLMSPLCAYLTIIVDYATGAIAGMSSGMNAWYFDRRLLTFGATLVIFPLTMFKSPKNLGFVSLLSLFALFYTSILICGSLLQDATEGEWEMPTVKYVNVDFGMIATFSTMCVAFINHTNHVEIISDLRKPSWARKTSLVIASYLTILGVYLGVGLSGYLHYGDSVGSNILNSEPTTLVFQIGRVCISLSSLLSYPLIIIPARSCLEWLTHELYVLRSKASSYEQLRNWEEGSKVRFYLETVFIIALSYFLAIYFSGLEKIFALFGALAGSMVVYIFPSLYFLKAIRENPNSSSGVWMGVLAAVNVLLGVVLFFVGTMYSFYDAFGR